MLYSAYGNYTEKERDLNKIILNIFGRIYLLGFRQDFLEILSRIRLGNFMSSVAFVAQREHSEQILQMPYDRHAVSCL